MSGCAMLSLTSPSLLAWDKQWVEGNVETIYGMPHAPCDTRMRERLAPVSPESLRAAFKSVVRQLQRGKALEEMVFLDGIISWHSMARGLFPRRRFTVTRACTRSIARVRSRIITNCWGRRFSIQTAVQSFR